ncbi:hypothetical protein [Sphingomonas sp.]|uniref:TadE/TadG family type IV pilus assembly protein n=1 Tax=Sphingomonas sp. TaxID=28214 RepID=UPI002D7F521A|nr:hypothetical protein [Sphingomonas sp.]HEU0044980.1 hypothetical protein [Sphingomonas sp.]
MTSRIGGVARRLKQDHSGLALMEFAFTLPIMLGLGGYGIEVSNLALVNLKLSQVALALADNASRVGATSTLSTQQLREVDINDVLQAVRVQGEGIELTTRGRITLSSLERVRQSYDAASPAALVQRIHWQRCIGLKSGTGYDSTYGTASANAGSTAAESNKGTDLAAGMGPTGSKVNAPDNSGVMFVEINYLTKPLFGTLLMEPARVHYIASFIVRDNRDFSRIFNPSPAATGSKCNAYAA